MNEMGLVLGRAPGEAVIMETKSGEKIRIEVIKTDGMLRLKIEAPKEVEIYREEIYEEQHKIRL
jgi:carbon storage regulator